jgi:hypothetical protein
VEKDTELEDESVEVEEMGLPTTNEEARGGWRRWRDISDADEREGKGEER